MQGEEKILTILNQALFLELGAVSQYWLHYRLLENWGYGKIAEKERKESLEEMRHADLLIARIIFLEGHPDLQSIAPFKIGRNLADVLRCDLDGEHRACAAYRASRALCEEYADYTTMKLFEKLLEEEEQHIDFLETQLSLLSSLGEVGYAQLQAL